MRTQTRTAFPSYFGQLTFVDHIVDSWYSHSHHSFSESSQLISRIVFDSTNHQATRGIKHSHCSRSEISSGSLFICQRKTTIFYDSLAINQRPSTAMVHRNPFVASALHVRLERCRLRPVASTDQWMFSARQRSWNRWLLIQMTIPKSSAVIRHCKSFRNLETNKFWETQPSLHVQPPTFKGHHFMAWVRLGKHRPRRARLGRTCDSRNLGDLTFKYGETIC
jgi:hypothetical protein